MNDGRVIEMKHGDVFHIEPGHDSWVIGHEPYVSVHFMGSGACAATPQNSNGPPLSGEPSPIP